MLNYRAYLLDGSNKIFHGEDIQAPNDAAAIATAQHLLAAHKASQPGMTNGVEVWHDRNLVFNSMSKA